MIATTHIAGLGLIISDRFARQRCAWCGEILVDEDAECMASTDPGPRDPFFAANALVNVRKDDGFTGYSVVKDETLPPDSCVLREKPRSAPRLVLVGAGS